MKKKKQNILPLDPLLDLENSLNSEIEYMYYTDEETSQDSDGYSHISNVVIKPRFDNFSDLITLIYRRFQNPLELYIIERVLKGCYKKENIEAKILPFYYGDTCNLSLKNEKEIFEKIKSILNMSSDVEKIMQLLDTEYEHIPTHIRILNNIDLVYIPKNEILVKGFDKNEMIRKSENDNLYKYILKGIEEHNNRKDMKKPFKITYPNGIIINDDTTEDKPYKLIDGYLRYMATSMGDTGKKFPYLLLT